MTIIGVAGAIGSGKSFTQLKHGLKYVEQRQKQLVTNFPINVNELRKYASQPVQYQSWFGYFKFNLKLLIYSFRYSFYSLAPKKLRKPKKPKVRPMLPWVKSLCESGGVIQIPSPRYIESLLIPESVVLLDEAGILLNSREFAKTSKQLLADLAQSRKDGCDLIWCAQFDEQVDRQLRLLTQFWIHCESYSMFDKKMRRPKLYYKRIFWFRCSDYQEWLQNPRARGSHIKTRYIYSTVYEGGLLNAADRQLFKVYDSFARLDKVYGGALINSMFQCKLPKDYYFRLLHYFPQFDPFSKKYEPLYCYYRKIKVAIKSNNVHHLELDKPALIKQALDISRSKNIKAPYFRGMTEQAIKQFIDNHAS